MKQSNMNAIWYLLLTKVKGQIRSLFRKKISALLTLIGLGFLVFSMVRAINNPSPSMATFQIDMTLGNVFAGLTLYVMLIVFIYNKKTALVYENDANAIFAGPFSQKQIYTYILTTNFFQSIMFGLMFIVYMLIFFNKSINGLPHILGLILSVFFHFILVLFYFTYEYIKEASKDFPKHLNRKIIIGLTLLIIALAVYTLYPPFNLESLKTVATTNTFKWIPFIGTFGWIGNMFVLGDITALFPISIISLLSLLLLVRIFNFKGNFIEKAVNDAQFASSTMKQVKDGNFEQTQNLNIDRVKKRKLTARFLPGGYSLFSKQLLILRKTRKLVPISMLILVITYGILGFAINDLNLFKILIVTGLIIGNDNTLLVEEMKKPYIYLIPDSELKKLVSTLIIPFVRVFILQLVNLVILIVLGNPILDSIIYILFVMSCYGVVLMVDCASAKILGSFKNVILTTYIKMFLYIISLLPTIAFLIGLFYVLNSISFNTLFIFGLILNSIVTYLGLLFSQSILKGHNAL